MPSRRRCRSATSSPSARSGARTPRWVAAAPGSRAFSRRRGSARGASAASSRAGSAANRRSASSCTTAASTSSRCSRATARAPCPSTSTTTTRPASCARCSRWSACEAIVYERRLAARLAEAVAGTGALLVDVDDGSGVGAAARQHAVRARRRAARGTALPEPSPDDLYMVCTGGTTGAPKAVLWRQADIFVAAMGGSEAATAETPRRDRAARPPVTWFPAPPLMHAAAQWTASPGCTSARRSPCTTTRAASTRAPSSTSLEREQVVDDVDRRRRLRAAADRGAAPRAARPAGAEAHRDRRRHHHRRVQAGPARAAAGRHDRRRLRRLRDRRHGVRRAHAQPGCATASRPPRARSCSPPTAAACSTPGDDEIGWTARRGRVPLGYLGDRAKTEATFPVVDGERMAVPGDRATLSADGAIRMLGRDSMVVNTGGEKVFVEEVEKALLRHPAVADALVVGRPSERFGQEVVALVQTRAGAPRPSPRRAARVRGQVDRAVQGAARRRVLRDARPPPDRQARLRVGAEGGASPRRRRRKRSRWISASAARVSSSSAAPPGSGSPPRRRSLPTARRWRWSAATASARRPRPPSWRGAIGTPVRALCGDLTAAGEAERITERAVARARRAAGDGGDDRARPARAAQRARRERRGLDRRPSRTSSSRRRARAARRCRRSSRAGAARS